ncbi:MAG: ribosome-binding factor A [bacterium]|nr:ribosome-binding factor A [bacterium]
MSTRNSEIKNGRISEILRELASEYIARESSGSSLITITNIKFDYTDNSALFFITSLPDTKRDAVIDFLKRKRSEIREYIKGKSRLGRIPFIDFVYDLGEKNRQKIDEIAVKVGIVPEEKKA